jgi:hypothetical protein
MGCGYELKRGSFGMNMNVKREIKINWIVRG